MLAQKTEGMQKSLSVPEILLSWLIQILHQELHIIRQILANLVLASLPNVADRLDQFLVHPLDIPSVRVVNLQAHILNWIVTPELELVLVDKKQG